MSERPTTKHDIQRDEVNSSRPGFSAVSRIHVSGSVSMTYTGVDAGTGEVTILVSGSASGDIGGWLSDPNTWSFLSADAPSFVVSVDANITGSIGVGMKTQMSHLGATKNFFLTQISVTGSVSYLNLYGGTDYTLTTGSITSPKYSFEKSPFGFPLDPTKWQVKVTDSTDRTQTNPTQNTWYNLGSISISLPIGAWDVDFAAAIMGYKSTEGTTSINAYITLSTANNSESDNELTTFCAINGAAGAMGVYQTSSRRKTIVVAAKTSYYLNARTTSVTDANTQITEYNSSVHPAVITARLAYL